LDLAPGMPNVLTDLGAMYGRVDKPEDATRYFDQAIAVDPSHEMSRYTKASSNCMT